MSETNGATEPMTTTLTLTGDQARIHCEALGIPTQESVVVEVVLRKPPASFVHRHTVPVDDEDRGARGSAAPSLRSVFKDAHDNLAKGDRWEALVTSITSLDAARREADCAGINYRVAKATAMLSATGKNAEQRDAEVVIKTETEAREAAHCQRLADSLEHLVIYLRGPASS